MPIIGAFEVNSVSPPDGGVLAGPTVLSFVVLRNDPGGSSGNQDFQLQDQLPPERFTATAAQTDFALAHDVSTSAPHPSVWAAGVRLADSDVTVAANIVTIPAQDAGTDVVIDYVRDVQVLGIDLNNLEVDLDYTGNPNPPVIYEHEVFAAGWTGVVEPLERGYRFTLTKAVPIPVGKHVTAAMIAADIGDPQNQMPSPFIWSFDTVPTALASISPAVVERDGGTQVLVAGTFDPLQDVAFRLVRGPVTLPCYSGQSGKGYAHGRPASSSLAQFITPPLPLGGAAWDVVGTQGGVDSTLTAALTAVAPSRKPGVFEFRQAFPPNYAMGPRELGEVALDVP